MSFDIWETKMGKTIEQTSADVRKWMYAMLALSASLVVIGVIKLFKNK